MKRLFGSIFEVSSKFIKRKPIILGLTLVTGLHMMNTYQLKAQCVSHSPLSDLLSKPILIKDKSSKNEV